MFHHDWLTVYDNNPGWWLRITEALWTNLVDLKHTHTQTHITSIGRVRAEFPNPFYWHVFLGKNDVLETLGFLGFQISIPPPTTPSLFGGNSPIKHHLRLAKSYFSSKALQSCCLSDSGNFASSTSKLSIIFQCFPWGKLMYMVGKKQWFP